MASVVVDTCVVSFALKRDTRAELYRPHLDDNLLVISFMTLAELYRWPLERGWGETRRMELERRLREYIVYPFTRDLCRQWAAATDQARRNGRPIDVDDAWVAATALLYDLPLGTHNRSDFEGVPHLRLVSES
jgi:tRNA(fMet)-specific endonuclease VapC